MTEHICTADECGWSCWIESGQPMRDMNIHFDDAGDVSVEAECNCDGHE